SGEIVLEQSAREDLGTSLSTKEAELTILEERLYRCQEELRRATTEADRLDQTITSGMARKKDMKSHLEDLAKEEIRQQSRLQDCLEQIETGRKELTDAGQRLTEQQAEESALQEKIREAQAEIDAALRKLEAIAVQGEDLRGETIENEAGQSAQRTRIGKIEDELANLGQQRAGVEATQKQQSTQHEISVAEAGRLEKEIEELEQTAAGLSATRREVQAELDGLREKAQLLETEEGELAERKLKTSSRIDVLQKYRDRLEGVGEGAVQVVREAAREEGALEGVIGLLADRFRVDPKHVRAVEAALDRLADAVLVRDLNSGLDAAAFLRAAGTGRGCFVPMPGGDDSESEVDTSSYPGVLGRASDLVECAEEDGPLVRSLLGRTFIVDSLATAAGLKELMGKGISFATTAGETLDADDVLTGGVAIKGRMSHGAELEELKEEILRISSRFEDVKARREDLGKTIGAVEEKEGHLRHQIYDLRQHEIVGRHKDLEKASHLSRELGEQLQVLAGNLREIASEQGLRESELSDAKTSLETLTARAASIRAEISELDERRTEAEAVKTASENRFHDLRVDHSRVSERVRHLEDERERISTRIREREEEYRDLVVRIEENGEKRESLKREMADLEEEIVDAGRRLGETRDEESRLLEARDGLESDVSFKKTEVRETLEQVEEVRNRLNELDKIETELRVRIEEAVSRAAEELSVVLTDLYEDFDDS
ncbi:MAG: coiled-coil domain-containing protein, partial [Planctomycetota bacterium]